MKCEYCRVIPCLDVKNGRLVKGVNLRMTRASPTPSASPSSPRAAPEPRRI